MRDLTQQRLKELLDYDPETGVFTWRISAGRRVKAGQRAGAVKASGYRVIGVCGDLHYEHRLAFLYMTGAFPKNDADHVNRDKADNRWSNLRDATVLQNSGNAGIRRDNTSGVKGVGWNKKAQKWMVRIRINGRSKYMGLFDDIGEAAAAYAEAAKKHFGEFAAPIANT